MGGFFSVFRWLYGRFGAVPVVPPSPSGRAFAPVGRGSAAVAAAGRGTTNQTVPGDDGQEAL